MANPTQQQSGDPNFLSFATSSSRYKAIVPSGTPPVLPAKPNATRACDECRRKKIKCISLDNSGYCKTCRRINQPCTFDTRVKKRGPRKGYITALESRLKRIEGLLNTAGDEDEDEGAERDRERSIISSPTPSQSSSHHSANSNSTAINLVQSLRQQHLTKEGRFISGYSMGYILSNKQYTAALSEQFGVQIQHNKKSDYYCVLKTGTYEDRRKDQINQLVATGQLKPGETINSIDEYIRLIADIDKRTSDYLLKVYFAHIHSLLPVINKSVFLEEYREIRASLPAAPVLRAIYGAAARYVTTLPQYSDVSFSIPENFSDILFQRMFKYLNGDYAPDLAAVQAIVITNNHCKNSTTWYNGWLMNCLAVRMCQDIGLHRSSEGWDIPQEEKETRRNVWWAVYTLDRWFSAETGKPLTIFEEDCDESYPSEYVSIENVMDKTTETDKHLPRFPSIDPQVVENSTDRFLPINEPFVQMIKLSEILGRILQGLYSPRAKKYSVEHGSDSIVAYLNNALSNWRSNLPTFLAISPASKLKAQDRSLTTMSGIICLSYCTSLILLHRPFIEKESDKKGAQSAVSICTNAAIRVIEVCEQMQLHDFLMVSWDFAVYPVLTASLIHIYNCSNDSSIVSDAAKSNLLRAMNVVDKLCSVTPCADNVAIILRKLVTKAKMFPSDPDFKSCYKRDLSSNIIERKLKRTATFPLAQSPNEQPSDDEARNGNWMNQLYTLDQPPLDINMHLDMNDTSSKGDDSNDGNRDSPNTNNQSKTGVPVDQFMFSDFNNTAILPDESANVPVALPEELFDFSEMYSFSNAQIDQTNDPSAMFRYQPDNPFWAVPNSMQPEDWQSFLLSFPK